jgi:hypothetical protein
MLVFSSRIFVFLSVIMFSDLSFHPLDSVIEHPISFMLQLQ